MDGRQQLILSIAVSVMGALGAVNGAIKGDKEIRRNAPFYPKHYAIPPRWIRKIFSLPKKEMAQFFIFQLYCTFLHIAIGIVNVFFILFNSEISAFIAYCILMLQSCWILVDSILYVVFLIKFRKK